MGVTCSPEGRGGGGASCCASQREGVDLLVYTLCQRVPVNQDGRFRRLLQEEGQEEEGEKKFAKANTDVLAKNLEQMAVKEETNKHQSGPRSLKHSPSETSLMCWVLNEENGRQVISCNYYRE